MTKKTYLLNKLEDLNAVATLLVGQFKHSLILLVGDLGAGKTTLTKAILSVKGCNDSGSSPSYSIINQYKMQDNSPLYHIDLYRLNTPEEAFNLGIEDLIYSGDFCFIEWPQLIFDYLEEPYHVINIQVQTDNSRHISLS